MLYLGLQYNITYIILKITGLETNRKAKTGDGKITDENMLTIKSVIKQNTKNFKMKNYTLKHQQTL